MMFEQARAGVSGGQRCPRGRPHRDERRGMERYIHTGTDKREFYKKCRDAQQEAPAAHQAKAQSPRHAPSLGSARAILVS